MQERYIPMEMFLAIASIDESEKHKFLMEIKVLGIELSRIDAIVDKKDTLLGYKFNNIQLIPGNLPLLKEIKIFEVEVLNSRIFPAPILEMEKLEQLLIRRSEIDEIPNSIDTLQHLHTLKLIAAKLYSLPDSLANCGKLRQLNLSFNNFINWPKIMSGISSLVHADFRGNLIRFDETFALSKNLNRLDLDGLVLHRKEEMEILKSKKQNTQIYLTSMGNDGLSTYEILLM
ncbi:MAG: leucine-rich repeat domain-containing protein [Candidatus Heimdallarchaeota archaeon]|nr:leucine-rich repeat domain-containing protein [Candidatus Heimdallarchaeota archaeon]